MLTRPHSGGSHPHPGVSFPPEPGRRKEEGPSRSWQGLAISWRGRRRAGAGPHHRHRRNRPHAAQQSGVEASTKATSAAWQPSLAASPSGGGQARARRRAPWPSAPTGLAVAGGPRLFSSARGPLGRAQLAKVREPASGLPAGPPVRRMLTGPPEFPASFPGRRPQPGSWALPHGPSATPAAKPAGPLEA